LAFAHWAALQAVEIPHQMTRNQTVQPSASVIRLATSWQTDVSGAVLTGRRMRMTTFVMVGVIVLVLFLAVSAAAKIVHEATLLE